MVRLCWIVLLSLVLAGCGQPLQINPTPMVAPARSPIQGATAISRATSAATATDLPTGGLPQAPTQAASPAITAEPTGSISATAVLAASAPPAAPTSGVVIVPRAPSPQSNQDRWRAQQIDRQALQQAQAYVAKNPVQLLWFDPVTAQSLEIGTLIGEFPVQARFTFRGTNSPALEVPYRINADYGLTSISEAVRERMRAAGYAETVEAYVIQTNDIVPK